MSPRDKRIVLINSFMPGIAEKVFKGRKIFNKRNKLILLSNWGKRPKIPLTTQMKSNIFHESRRYEFLSRIKPYEIDFNKNSATKKIRKKLLKKCPIVTVVSSSEVSKTKRIEAIMTIVFISKLNFLLRHILKHLKRKSLSLENKK
jgi:hypothetical protein